MITLNIKHKVYPYSEPQDYNIELASIEKARQCIAEQINLDLQYGCFTETKNDGDIIVGGENKITFTGTYVEFDNPEAGTYAHYHITES